MRDRNFFLWILVIFRQGGFWVLANRTQRDLIPPLLMMELADKKSIKDEIKKFDTEWEGIENECEKFHFFLSYTPTEALKVSQLKYRKQLSK